jgi:anthranilate phosphoribosyltransferase
VSDFLIEAVRILGSGRALTEAEACDAVSVVIDGAASDVSLAAFLTALRIKGETAAELAGAVRCARSRMTLLFDEGCPGPADPDWIDTCGTGGDGAGTLNISTAVAIVAAASGMPVAKHGNRSASGVSGSSDVLTELGVNLEPGIDTLRACLTKLGLTFLFAPRFHPALRHAATVRKQLPFRTLFNLVGPLANPACPPYQLVGTPDPRQADVLARALADLGLKRGAVVTGSDGLDEVTLDGPTRVLWVESGRVSECEWTPEMLGLPRVEAAALRVASAIESATRIRAMLNGADGPDRSIVLANTAAVLLVGGRVDTLRDGVERAGRAIDSGAAHALLGAWAALTHSGAGGV